MYELKNAKEEPIENNDIIMNKVSKIHSEIISEYNNHEFDYKQLNKVISSITDKAVYAYGIGAN
jgi:hypothetical protein